MREVACSMQLMLIFVLLELQAALADLCLMLLALLPQTLTLSQKYLPAIAWHSQCAQLTNSYTYMKLL